MSLNDDLYFGVLGVSSFTRELRFAVQSIATVNDDLLFNLEGKTYQDLNFATFGKSVGDLGFVLEGEEPFDSKYHFYEDEVSDFYMTSDSIINEISIKFQKDLVAGSHQAIITKSNALSQELYGDNPAYSKTYESDFLQDQVVANEVADGFLLSGSIPPIICHLTHNITSFYLEENDGVLITHSAGVGENGFVSAKGYIISKTVRNGVEIDYTILMKPLNENLLKSELIRLVFATGVGGSSGISIQAVEGGYVLTITSNTTGYPPIEGVTVRIGGTKKVTNSKGQVFFELEPGVYTIYLSAPGYNDIEYQITI